MEAIKIKPNYNATAQKYLEIKTREMQDENEINPTDIDFRYIRYDGRCELQNDAELRYTSSPTHGLHKEYECERSVTEKGLCADLYGHARREGRSKFKFARETAFGRTISGHVRATVTIGLLLLLAVSSAAPARPRTARSTHHSKSVVSFVHPIT